MYNACTCVHVWIIRILTNVRANKKLVSSHQLTLHVYICVKELCTYVNSTSMEATNQQLANTAPRAASDGPRCPSICVFVRSLVDFDPKNV